MPVTTPMTYQQAMDVRLRQIQRQPVDPELAAEALRVIQATRGSLTAPAPIPPRAVPVTAPVLPRRPGPEVDLCECGYRLGQHRFGDDACPNHRWRCGNGEPQWLTRWYAPMQREAAAPSAAQPQERA